MSYDTGGLFGWKAAATRLTNQIVEHLNSQQFGMAVVARRRVAPLVFVEAGELDQVQVWVFAGAKSSTRLARDSWEHRWRPLITVQKKLHGTDEPSQIEEVDQLLNLVEQIEMALEGHDFNGFTMTTLSQDQDRDYFDPDAMRNFSVFAAVLEPEYTD